MAEQQSVVVITPVWRPRLSSDEILRLRLTHEATTGWRHVILHPDGLATGELQSALPEWRFHSCDPGRLSSVRSYSTWLLQQDFYEEFTDSEFMLIAQLDSVVLRRPPLDAFAYDYLGAPWSPPFRVVVTRGRMRVIRSFGFAWGRQLEVGNGGLSIRRTRRMAEAAERLLRIAGPRVMDSANEDAVWSYFAKELGLRLAPARIASIFRDIETDCELDTTNLCGIHGLTEATPRANRSVRLFAS